MDNLRKFLNENENAKLYLLLIFVLGIILITTGRFVKVESTSEVAVPTMSEAIVTQSYDSYEDKLTAELETILSRVDGAGEVKCMITFANTTETVYATDFEEDNSSVVERDSENGERTTTKGNRDEKLVFIGENEPIVVKELLPKVEGIVIVAQGGENVYIKKQFTDVATSLLDVDAHKVQILKMN